MTARKAPHIRPTETIVVTAIYEVAKHRDQQAFDIAVDESTRTMESRMTRRKSYTWAVLPPPEKL